MSKTLESFVVNQRKILSLHQLMFAAIKAQQAEVDKFAKGFAPEELVGLNLIEIKSTYQGPKVFSYQITADILASMTIPSGNSLEKFGYPYMGFDVSGTEDLLGDLSWDNKADKLKEFLGESFNTIFAPESVFLYFYEVDGQAMGMNPKHNIITDVVIKLA